MSKLMVILATVAMSCSAYAGDMDKDFQVEFLSWCQGEKVMQYNEKGEVVLRFDCAEYAQSCKTYQYTRWYRTTFVAACEKQN
jgi:hypothetical protein